MPNLASGMIKACYWEQYSTSQHLRAGFCAPFDEKVVEMGIRHGRTLLSLRRFCRGLKAELRPATGRDILDIQVQSL